MSFRPLFFAVLCVLGFCLPFIAAAPEMFVGGSFDRAGMSYSPEFAIYDEAGTDKVGGWVRHPAAGNGDLIVDMDIAGNGVFAALNTGAQSKREWDDETGLDARGVAYFDGQHWIAVREAPREPVQAVSCFDSTNCYVVGRSLSTLYGRLGPSDPNAYVEFLVHYQLNGNQWVWVNDDTDSWTFNSSTKNPPNGDVQPKGFKITQVGDGGEKLFWVLVNGDVYRGSATLDGGWTLFTSQVGYINDFAIDEAGDRMYVVGTMPERNAVTTGLTTSTPNTLVWNPFSEVNETHISELHRIALSGDTRYVAGFWLERPGGDYLPYVFSQTENHEPVPLGLPLNYKSEFDFDYLTVDSDGAPVVFSDDLTGTDWIINPDDPSSQRPTRDTYYTAKWSSADSRWVQPFGGGLFDDVKAYAHDSTTGRWFFSGSFNYVFDLVGSAVWWDNDETLRAANQPNPWNTLVYKHLWRRSGPAAQVADHGTIHEILYHSQYPDALVVAGSFDGIGDTDETHGYGGIFATSIAGTENDVQLFSIGEGLWELHYDTADDRVGYLTSGSVDSVAVASLLGEESYYLYAGGSFHRTKSGSCLRNIARINLQTLRDQPETAAWEDVAGGCDGPIEDMLYRWGNLYVTGRFMYCGSIRVNGIAKLSWVLRGDAMVLEWSALNYGLESFNGEPIGLTLEPWADGFVVGGRFDRAGGISGNPIHWSIVHERFSPLAPACPGGCQDERTFTYPFPDESTVVSLRRNGLKNRLYAVVITPGPECCKRNQANTRSEEELRNTVFWDGVLWREVNVRREERSRHYPDSNIGKHLNRNLTAERTATLLDRIMLVANVDGYGPDANVAFGAYHEDYDNVVDSHFAVEDSSVRTIAIPEPSYTSSASSLQSFFSLLSVFF